MSVYLKRKPTFYLGNWVISQGSNKILRLLDPEEARRRRSGNSSEKRTAADPAGGGRRGGRASRPGEKAGERKNGEEDVLVVVMRELRFNSVEKYKTESKLKVQFISLLKSRHGIQREIT